MLNNIMVSDQIRTQKGCAELNVKRGSFTEQDKRWLEKFRV